MEKEIRINYLNGEIVVLSDRFFPASKIDINKLLKTAELDSTPDAVVDTILEALHEMAAQDKHTMMQIKEQAPKTYNRMCETRELVASAKRPFGVRLTDAEYKDAQKELRRLKEECKRLEREFAKTKRHREKIEENYAYIYDKTGRRNRNERDTGKQD